MYAQLGDIIFEGLKGLTGMRGKFAQKIAQHELIDSKPKLQKTGDALDELAIDMTFHRKFCNPESEIAKLKRAITRGAVLPLITGTGELVGNFTVASMDVDTKHTGPTGLVVMAVVSANLIEAAQTDPLGAALSSAKSVAFANGSNSPLVMAQIKPFKGPGLEAAAALKKADSFQESGARSLSQAKVNTPVQTGELRKAKDAFKKVNESIDSFQEALTKIRGTVNNLTGINAAAASIKTYAQNTLTAIENNDIDGAIAASNDTRQGVLTLNGESAQLIVQTASRRI